MYDAAGNMTFNPLGRNVGDPTSCNPAIPGCPSGQLYFYDEENRVTEIRSATTGRTLLTFAYDAIGRRIETNEYVDPQTGAIWNGLGISPYPRVTRHVYSGLETVQEYTCRTNLPGCGTWQLDREFVWGDSARFPEPVAMVDYTGAGHTGSVPAGGYTYHYLRDVLGSITGLTDANGAILEQYTYDPYGKTVIQDVLHANWPASAFGNPFMWTGQRYDAATATYHFWARTYSPTLGRWLQCDPARYLDGPNLYAYVRARPLVGRDALGLLAEQSQCPKKNECTDAGGADGPQTVEVCCRNINVNYAANATASTLGYRHCWIRTSQKEAGMGPADGSNPDNNKSPCYGTQTTINDHNGEGAKSGTTCYKVRDCNGQCVNNALRIGKACGTWGPTNNCNTLVTDILEGCHCRNVVRKWDPHPTEWEVPTDILPPIYVINELGKPKFIGFTWPWELEKGK